MVILLKAAQTSSSSEVQWLYTNMEIFTHLAITIKQHAQHLSFLLLVKGSICWGDKNTTSKMLLKRPNLRFNYRRLGIPAVSKTNCYILHTHSVRTDREIGWTSTYIDTIYKHVRLTKLALHDSSQLGCCFKERRSVRDRRLQKCTYK